MTNKVVYKAEAGHHSGTGDLLAHIRALQRRIEDYGNDNVYMRWWEQNVGQEVE